MKDYLKFLKKLKLKSKKKPSKSIEMDKTDPMYDSSQLESRQSNITQTFHNLGLLAKGVLKNHTTIGQNQNPSSIYTLLRPHQLVQKFFNVKDRPFVHRLFTYIILASSAFTIGKMIGVALTGTDATTPTSNISFDFPPAELIPNQTQKIQMANLFDALSSQGPIADNQSKGPINEDIPCLKGDSATKLPIKLINTVVLQDSVKSVASVQIRNSGELLGVREGEKINQMAKINKIDRLKVVLKNLENGNCEYLVNDENKFTPMTNIRVLSPEVGKKLLDMNKPKGIKSEGNGLIICQSFMKDQMKNMSNLMTQAKADPYPLPDGGLAFRISQISPGGIFSKLNISSGDIIKKINGKKIQSLQDVMSLFSKITTLDKLNLTIDRDGNEIPLEYRFDKREDCEESL